MFPMLFTLKIHLSWCLIYRECLRILDSTRGLSYANYLTQTNKDHDRGVLRFGEFIISHKKKK